MKHSNELSAKAVNKLLGNSVYEYEATLYLLNLADSNEGAIELMCHRVHKALCDLTGYCVFYPYQESIVYDYGCLKEFYTKGEGETHEEAILNAAVDYYLKEKGDG